jgi:hypothetical protein
MASKKDYSKVTESSARIGRVVEVVAASINSNKESRAKSLEIARDPVTNRKRAERRFDERAAKRAKSRKRSK